MSGLSNALTKLTQTNQPIWQAPLPFDLIPAHVAGTISAHGALGAIRIGEHSNKNDLTAAIEAYKLHHNHPAFCFAHALPNTDTALANQDEYQHLFAQAGLETSQIGQPDTFSELLEIAINSQPRAIGFAQGLPQRHDLERIRTASILTFAICHSVAEAVVAEDQGIDIVVLQGDEAGGLHSHFPNTLPQQPQNVLTLLKQARELVSCPLVVWGDFPQGRDIVAAIISGAQAVMIDRPLLSCNEIELNESQRTQLQTQNETQSLISDQFSTLPMRLLPNPLTERLHSDHPQREIILHEILRRRPEWRPLCVSPTLCKQYSTISDCFNAYQQDIAQYLA
ncbi:nitronate monooxygenase [Cardiobacteriaceae bacterium TAE3-ERU3]|nr:nitronate monooxygenase [Cardiobacteriaceae bacterium TAE3-ERU3]